MRIYSFAPVMVFGRAYRHDNPACPAPLLRHLPRSGADASAALRRARGEGANGMRVGKLLDQFLQR
jgi:hypothetical protein